MDCKTARLLIEFFRPVASELNASEAEALEQHLAECTECGRFAQAERAWESRVARMVQDVPVPARLHERLQAGLEQQRAQWRRQSTGRALAGAAVAATLFLVVAFGWYWKRTHPPRLDLEQVAADFFA